VWLCASTVADAKGQPLAGARTGVMADMAIVARGVTDAQGRATLAAPADATIEYVYAWKSGTGFDYLSFVKPRPGRPQVPTPALPQGAIALQLTGARTLRVTALDGEGPPLAKLPLYLWYLQKPGETSDINLVWGDSRVWRRHGRAGHCGLRLAARLARRRLDRVPWAPDHARRRLMWDPKKGGEATLVLDRLEVLRGRVTHANGVAAPGITIKAAGDGYEFDGFWGETKTDADGQYELHVAPNLLYLVAVVDNNFAAEPHTGFAVFPKTPVLVDDPAMGVRARASPRRKIDSERDLRIRRRLRIVLKSFSQDVATAAVFERPC
jgi:hypothetical protein